MKNVVLNIEGMSCNHCVNSVEGALLKLFGVERVEVSLNENNVTVAYKEKQVTVEELKKAIEDQGYDVRTE